VKQKAAKREVDRCERLLRHWQYCLGLKWWNIEAIYYSSAKQYQKATGSDRAACVHADWEYLKAFISICLPVTRTLKKRDLRRMITHELVHCLVSEMREADPTFKHEERVVTTITNALRWTALHGKDESQR
jgi:hypothetical protein